jgi:hypothetical protein
VITPDRYIFNQHVWPPTQENITAAVIEAGGMLVGLDEQAQVPAYHDLNVYPNPIVDRVNISFEAAQRSEYHVELISLSGMTVYSSQPAVMEVGKHDISFNPGNIDRGIYIIRLMRNNQTLESIKVVSR